MQKCKNCSRVCVYHCTQLSYTTQHRAVPIIFLLILQTSTRAQMLFIGGEAGGEITRRCSFLPNYLGHLLLFFTLSTIWSQEISKIRSTTINYRISWNDLPPHQQRSDKVELHWCVESTSSTTGKKAAFENFAWNIGSPSTKTTEKQNNWTIKRTECFHRNWLKYVATFQRSVLGRPTSCKLSVQLIIIITVSLSSSYTNNNNTIHYSKITKTFYQKFFGLNWWLSMHAVSVMLPSAVEVPYTVTEPSLL